MEALTAFQNANQNALNAPEKHIESNLYDYASTQRETGVYNPEALRMANPTEMMSELATRADDVFDRVSSMGADNVHNLQPSSHTLYFDKSSYLGDRGHTPQHAPMSTSQRHGSGSSFTSEEHLRPVVEHMKQIFNYSIEVTLISKSTSQFSSSVNTLMKGQ